ncbi:hypothetical protein JR316_0008743 [Psilocybe cubensis]|uniref:Uncharacterized protein n=2 Tax=Psilocybe cubensis TaxID=181762 RepID=A0ACB8GS34_PSICU|nr:hypothetical protein JR316_0008743 [Psilocybe cubensis]KAH9478290.1 hypothetical protein JR316_0008743 [Psilocybe cubensis]
MSPQNKLTDHKILIFDVYGTLADWESGIHNALKPLLERYPASKTWSRQEALTAFGSVESDLQVQYPEMIYSELLAKVHERLEDRLKAQSGVASSENPFLAPGEAEVTSGAGAGSSGSAGAETQAAAASPGSDDEHKAFGASIQNWTIFPDTCAALQRLAKHFKLVVLSNVDRDSFRHTHALLSEGPTRDTITSDIRTYTYPDPNPDRFWHPQEAKGSKSPFTLIVTAQDVGCYKPALGGFRAILEYAKAHPELFGDLELAEGEDVKEKALSVAQSIPHDHVAAKNIGMRSVWIDRQSAVTCNVDPDGPGAKEKWSWKFETLGEMADAVEKELAAST